jgi:hypothetical protein
MTAAIDVEEVLSKLDIVEKISLLSGTPLTTYCFIFHISC